MTPSSGSSGPWPQLLDFLPDDVYRIRIGLSVAAGVRGRALASLELLARSSVVTMARPQHEVHCGCTADARTAPTLASDRGLTSQPPQGGSREMRPRPVLALMAASVMASRRRAARHSAPATGSRLRSHGRPGHGRAPFGPGRQCRHLRRQGHSGKRGHHDPLQRPRHGRPSDDLPTSSGPPL